MWNYYFIVNNAVICIKSYFNTKLENFYNSINFLQIDYITNFQLCCYMLNLYSLFKLIIIFKYLTTIVTKKNLAIKKSLKCVNKDKI